MLTADLVPVRRKNGELLITPLVGKVRKQHLELAEEVAEIAGNSLGMSREQLESELSGVGQTPGEKRIARALAKLVEDATTFEQDRGRGAVELREILFEQAAAHWRSLSADQRFDRNQVVGKIAAQRNIDVAELEDGLFVDLPSAQRVLEPMTSTGEQLVQLYERSRIAAVLMRATEVTASFRIHNVLGVRALFRALKFRQLMFQLDRLADGRHRLKVTGPYSLFESVTKYGLQLALCWPALSILDDLELQAELRWGKANERLRFTLPRDRQNSSVQEPPVRSSTVAATTDEVSELRQALQSAAPDATVADGEIVLDLPGIGLCVPDLCFRSADDVRVHIEVLGYWSRQTLWQRVELVEHGLVEPVLFVASSRLRVSEDVLDDHSTGAVLVYRGRINPHKVLAKVTALAERRRSRQQSVPQST